MFSKSAKFLTLACLIASSLAAPLQRREVPQEHAHQQTLDVVNALLKSGNAAESNPLGIQDAVFGLLGDAAAAAGAGDVPDVKCLQQATADQAFTDAKNAGDVAGATAALIYRTLERNTGKVGLKSDLCESIQAVNPEIAALSQHQDPASEGAQETNKAIVLELAKQIASIGGDPLEALKSGTFAPGDVNDPTAKGNSCNDQPDPVGCIFTKNLLVPDATEAEIQAAVAGAGAGAEAGNQGGKANEEVVDNKGKGEAAATATAEATATETGIAGETATAAEHTATATAEATGAATETAAAEETATAAENTATATAEATATATENTATATAEVTATATATETAAGEATATATENTATATGADATLTAEATATATDCPPNQTVTVTVTAGAVETGAANGGKQGGKKNKGQGHKQQAQAGGIAAQIIKGIKNKAGAQAGEAASPQAGAAKADNKVAAQGEQAAAHDVKAAQPAPAAAHEKRLSMRFNFMKRRLA